MSKLNQPPVVFTVAATLSLLMFALLPFTVLYGACVGGHCADWLNAFGPVETAARAAYVTFSAVAPIALLVVALRAFLAWSRARVAAADAADGERAGTAELHSQLTGLTLVMPVLLAIVLLTWVTTLF
jgi:Zn-dependent protease with chaperone function